MFLRFIAATSMRLGLLGLVRMLGAGIDAQIAELHAAERSARNHALDRLFDHALGEPALEDRLGGAFLDAADEAGVIVIDLVVTLAPGQHHMRGVDDDDVVAAIDMGRVGRKMLAAQPHRDEGGEPADHQTFGVDQHPLLRHLGGLCRITFSCEEIREQEISARARRTARVSREAAGRASMPNGANYLPVITMAYKYGAILPA